MAFDYSRRAVVFMALFTPSGDHERDEAALRALYAPSMARHSESHARQKQKTLEELLRRALGPRASRVSPTIGMPAGADGMPWAFRQKAAFGGGTNDVVPVTECPVHAGRAKQHDDMTLVVVRVLPA